MVRYNRCSVISSSEAAEPTRFGPAEMAGAYVAVIGVFPPGEPAPPLHLHPDTDEAFYLAEGEATFCSATARSWREAATSSSFRGAQRTQSGTPARSRFVG